MMTDTYEIDERRWTTIADVLRNSHGMHWDGCHKIYVAMDANADTRMVGLGYIRHEPSIEELKAWFADSCSLRFVQAVFTNDADPNAGFVDLVGQFERSRRAIHIEPTDEQWETIDELFGLATPFIAAVTDEHGAPTGELWAERIIDDSEVRLYTIAPDGSYAYEELDGLHHGWTRYDEAGEVTEED